MMRSIHKADAADLPFAEPDWTAKWIWCKEQTEGRNDFVYFRKKFQFEVSLGDAYLYVTADKFYEIWINGIFIGRGPALSDPAFKRYDVYKVSDYLKTGQNCIAAMVYHDCSRFRMTSNAEAYGFLCQLNVKDKPVAATDETWKAVLSRAWRDDITYVDDITWMECYDSRFAPENEKCRKNTVNTIFGL